METNKPTMYDLALMGGDLTHHQGKLKDVRARLETARKNVATLEVEEADQKKTTDSVEDRMRKMIKEMGL